MYLEPGRVSWAAVWPDTLIEILKWLPVKDRLQTVPQICKAWRKASFDPLCWRAVDLREWCRKKPVDVIDRMVRLVINRSRGHMQELRLSRLEGDSTLQLLAQSDLSSLKTLCIPSSVIPENSLCKLILSLPGLVHLDISKCCTINSKALKIIGQTCKSLTRLDRVLWPEPVPTWWPMDLGDSEALTIAQYMPKLKHLVMSSDWVSKSSLDVIRASCKDLQFVEVKSVDDGEYDLDDDFDDHIVDDSEDEDEDDDIDEEEDEEDTDDNSDPFEEVKSVDDDEYGLDVDFDDHIVDDEDDEDDLDEDDEDDEEDDEEDTDDNSDPFSVDDTEYDLDDGFDDHIFDDEDDPDEEDEDDDTDEEDTDDSGDSF
ncbi:hypothetical protein R1sor_013292 [Riccia sorocarpa]|uniref:F-box domain-containing protein n=1 Tax=Riccia sorocarpa TaxID=122646 RepID=A0ABD3H697_9MARC